MGLSNSLTGAKKRCSTLLRKSIDLSVGILKKTQRKVASWLFSSSATQKEYIAAKLDDASKWIAVLLSTGPLGKLWNGQMLSLADCWHLALCIFLVMSLQALVWRLKR